MLGAQRPRLLAVPADVTSTAGQEATELAASAGLILDDWQRFVLDVALSERSDGQWSAFEVGLVVGRQNGKGSILEARELAGLFLFGERLILHSAHEFKTAAEAFLRVKALVDNTDDLRRKVKQIRTSHGDEGIELLTGARLRFVARSRGSGRGFSGDCVILDEAYNLGGEAMGALLPTLSARPNPQIWYTSSAPMETSSQLHAVRRRAVAGGDGRLAFLEWSIDPDTDAHDDPRSWARANPSLGIRIPDEFIAAEMNAMPAHEFGRERLGIPDPEPEVAPPVVALADWDRCADPKVEHVGKVGFAVDVAPGGVSAAISIIGIRSDGIPHVALVDHRPGVDWIEDRRRELDEKYRPKLWVRDPSGPAVELAGRYHDLTSRESMEAATRLTTGVAERGFRWACDASLRAAVRAAVIGACRRDIGDGNWRWSRMKSDVDISPLVSMTNALWAAPIVARAKPVAVFV